MKIIERVRFGARGQGSLILLEGSANWFSCYCVRGKEHRESTGTPDLKLARRHHRRKLDEIAADRQGLKKFLTPVAQRVRICELLTDLEADYRLRKVKSWAQFKSHLKPIREHFGAWRAVEITAEAVDAYIEERLEADKAPATVNRETQLIGQAHAARAGAASDHGHPVDPPPPREQRSPGLLRAARFQGRRNGVSGLLKGLRPVRLPDRLA